MKTKSYTVEQKDVGQRLDKWLAQIPEINSRSFAQDLIQKNHVLVDGKPPKPSLELKLNHVVEIEFPEAKSVGLEPYDFKLDIIFEDDDLIVLNKPAGLVVHPAAGHEQDTLVNALLHHTKQLSMKNELRPGIVHRIDKETSGLLVIAKNDFAHDFLAAQFKEKTSHRIYYAVVEKDLKNEKGTIQSYLARHPVDRKRYSSVKDNNRIITHFSESFEDGKWAVTHYRKISMTRIDKYSLLNYVKIKLETGRTHQIRVHMSEMGHPLLGDMTYGGSRGLVQKFNLNRFFLHAAELGFNHPKTKEEMMFKVSWPVDDRKQLVQMGFTNELPGM